MPLPSFSNWLAIRSQEPPQADRLATVIAQAGAAGDWIVDLLESGGREKSEHDHQRTLTDVEYLIDNLTEPGALVVDPYFGSGTVSAACKKLGRQWLACEIESQTAATARRQVA